MIEKQTFWWCRYKHSNDVDVETYILMKKKQTVYLFNINTWPFNYHILCLTDATDND